MCTPRLPFLPCLVILATFGLAALGCTEPNPDFDPSAGGVGGVGPSGSGYEPAGPNDPGDPGDPADPKDHGGPSKGAPSGPCQTLWRDADGDGFGDPTRAVDRCDGVVMPGTVPAGTPPDCDDDDPRVFPGQSRAFDSPARHGGFDYDCDGREFPADMRIFGRCERGPGGCVGGGWSERVPGCGEWRHYVRCELGDGFGKEPRCVPVAEKRRGACR